MSDLRVGVVGSGFMARQHLASWRAIGAQLTVYSHDTQSADQLAEKHGIVASDSLDDLMASCDVVDICTPTDQHLQVAAAAASAGVHVICEKPLTRTSAETEQMMNLCAEAGVRLFPAHVVRYIESYDAARREIQRGTLGEIAVAHLYRAGPRPTWSSWFSDQNRSGGILMDFMIHDYDIALWFAGPVRKVWARTLGDGTTGKQVGVVMLTHASGAISHVEGTWNEPTSPLTSSFQLFGDQGYLRSGASPGTDVQLRDPNGTTRRLSPRWTADSPDPFRDQLADFASALKTGTEARTTAADGLNAVRVAEAAVESERLRVAIDIDVDR